jgi:CDGSH-type Zn-finger protein
MSDKPEIAGLKSEKITMEPGTYWWCSCGRSQNQPFCDGAHSGTSFNPVKVEVEEKQMIAWCTCKHSQKGFRCDGAHRALKTQE